MLEAEEDTIVDLRISCTIEDAIAKMLGWLQGPHFKKIIKTTEYGISPDELPYLLKLPDKLERQLERNRKIAANNLSEAIEDYENYINKQKDRIPNDEIEDRKNQAIQEKIKVLKNATKTTENARLYKMAISSELTKDESSVLKIDQEATEKSGVTHITLESLHNWAKEKFGISVCPEIDQHSETQTKLQPEESDCVTEKVSVREKNILTTLAFLTEAFAKTKSKYQNGEEPNYKNIAEHLENLAKEANHNQRLSGQSIESIRKLLSSANDTKLQVINKKGDGV